MKYLIYIIIIIFSIEELCAQDTVKIATSAVCKSCKNRMESKLSKFKGIRKVNLNVDTKELLVSYDSKLISKETIEIRVTEIGYDANGKAAKKGAYKRLPACCRKDYQGTH